MNCSRMHHKPKSVVSSSVLNVLFFYFSTFCNHYRTIIFYMVYNNANGPHMLHIQTLSIFTLLKENCHSYGIAELSWMEKKLSTPLTEKFQQVWFVIHQMCLGGTQEVCRGDSKSFDIFDGNGF